METGGARAVYNGILCEQHIKSCLKLKGLARSPARTLEEFKQSRGSLFPNAGQFAEQCKVPLTAPYHQGKELFARVDFLVYTLAGEFIVLSVKSQESDGSADEKLEYGINQLIATELPAAMLVFGPLRGTDAKEGWRPHVLSAIWDRVRAGERIYLFRDETKLSRWINDGMPVAGRGRKFSDVFQMYCNREP